MACALVPFQWTDAVARRDHNLLIFSGLEFSGGDAPANRADFDRQEFIPFDMFEPVVARQQIRFAITVDIRGGGPFGITGGPRLAFTRLAAENDGRGPRLIVTR